MFGYTKIQITKTPLILNFEHVLKKIRKNFRNFFFLKILVITFCITARKINRVHQKIHAQNRKIRFFLSLTSIFVIVTMSLRAETPRSPRLDNSRIVAKRKLEKYYSLPILQCYEIFCRFLTIFGNFLIF